MTVLSTLALLFLPPALCMPAGVRLRARPWTWTLSVAMSRFSVNMLDRRP
jgi:hypothetical protein